jgi:dihydropyrimidinase
MTKLIRGGTVVNHDHSRHADVLTKDGAIVAIGANLEASAGAEVIDAGGCYVMPGGIDPHTHLEFMFMGTVTADDFEWGTKAALSGGTTMVVDFCIPNPGQSMLAAYQDWRRKAEGAACDYGFHMAVTSWNKQVFDEMETVVKTYGINTFKHFMAYKGALMVNDDELYNSFLRCAGLGAMPLVHAENGDVIWHLQQHYLGSGVTGPEGHAFSRPPAVEGEAANRAIMIADMAGCPIYIVHTSCREAHDAIARARAAGQRVFGEPLIQHLTLDEDEYRNKDWDYASRRVMSPPFRPKDHQASLWGRPAIGLFAGRGDRSLRFHHRAEAARPHRLHQDSEWHRRARGQAAGSLDGRRQYRADHQGRIRRGDVGEHRAYPQRLSAQGRGCRRFGRRSGDLRSESHQDHLRQETDQPHRL